MRLKQEGTEPKQELRPIVHRSGELQDGDVFKKIPGVWSPTERKKSALNGRFFKETMGVLKA